MTSIRRRIDINAPADRVWELLADFGNIHRFNPSVPSSHTTNEIRGRGATRHCDLGGGSSLEEVIADWEEGRSMTIHIVDGKRTPPFKGDPVARITLEDRGDRSRVEGVLSYELKMGILGKAMNAMMVERQFAKAWSGLLEGLKHHAETGHRVNDFGDIAHLQAVEPVGAGSR